LIHLHHNARENTYCFSYFLVSRGGFFRLGGLKLVKKIIQRANGRRSVDPNSGFHVKLSINHLQLEHYLAPFVLFVNIKVLNNESLMRYDLIVVGTGFASTFFLKKYLERAPANARVLVLERGILHSHQNRLALLRGESVSYEHALTQADATFNNQNPGKPWIFDVHFGGSSNCWWGCTPRFKAEDFQIKSKYGVGLDWPIGYNDLEPYYAEAEDIMQIAGHPSSLFQRSTAYPLPAHAFSSLDKRMQASYGDSWIQQPTARASQPVAGRNPCCSSYSCNVCPANAKFTIENGLSSVYKDPRIELKMQSIVTHLSFSGNRVEKVHVVDAAKSMTEPTRHYEADVVALGANAIFNAHILLNSGDRHPLTGRGLAEQKGFFATIHTGVANMGGGSSITANGYMEYDGPQRRSQASCLIENHNAPIIRNERGKWRHLARIKFVVETLLNDENRVEKSKDLLKPNVIYQEASAYADQVKPYIEAKSASLFAPLKPEGFMFEKSFLPTECHLLSSVRMGKSSELGVVDDTLVHFNYRNLLVLGGSSFPSISASNPTLTLSALSLRSADLLFPKK
jgi:choline dehydrogenase-like flavoprotein